MISRTECERCNHNKVCRLKDDYRKIYDKILNSCDNSSYFDVKVSCRHHEERVLRGPIDR